MPVARGHGPGLMTRRERIWTSQEPDCTHLGGTELRDLLDHVKQGPQTTPADLRTTGAGHWRGATHRGAGPGLPLNGCQGRAVHAAQ